MRLQLDSIALSPNDSLKPNDSAPVSAAAGRGATAASRSANADGGDSIGISGPSAALSALSNDRAARIQQLTVAVRNGSYDVSAKAISAAIVDQATG